VSFSKQVLLLARELDSGGSERQLAETAKTLQRNGWSVHAGCFHDSGIRAQELRAAGIPVVRFPVHSFQSLSAVSGMAAFRRYVQRHKIALTHSFDTPLTIFSTLATRFSPRLVVLSSQRSYRSLFTPTEQRLLRFTDRLVDGVVVNCDAIRQHMTADEGVPANRIHLCYNGIDTDQFCRTPAPRPQALAGASLVIGTVAVLRPEKDLATLFHAFASIRRDYPGIRLLVVGSGPLRQTLEDLGRTLGIAADVYIEPATPHVAQWLNAMDIFVLPSLSEALSNALMEAMACGVAPVASHTGGNPELVREGITGLLFPPGNAEALALQIRRLADDKDLRLRVGDAAMSFIRSEMTLAKAGTCMAGIYSGLLSQTESRARQKHDPSQPGA
jgi:glycosyltransferase involved in cell wall biosynthesis